MSINQPPFSSFPILESDDIIMRELVESDFDDILPIIYYNGIQAKNLDDVKNMLNRIKQDYLNGDSVNWGISDKDQNRIMGTIGYYRGFHKNTGELGFILKEEFRGNGYMRKAVKMAAEFGLNEMHLSRIIAITTLTNYRTINLLEKINFVKLNLDAKSRPVFEYRP